MQRPHGGNVVCSRQNDKSQMRNQKLVRDEIRESDRPGHKRGWRPEAEFCSVTRRGGPYVL